MFYYTLVKLKYNIAYCTLYNLLKEKQLWYYVRLAKNLFRIFFLFQLQFLVDKKLILSN